MSDHPEIPREGQQVHIYHYYGAAAPDPRVGEALALIRQLTNQLTTQGATIMTVLSDLQQAAADETTVNASVVALLAELAVKLQAAIDSGNPVEVQAVIDTMRSNHDALAAAVAANTTPVTPTPEPPVP